MIVICMTNTQPIERLAERFGLKPGRPSTTGVLLFTSTVSPDDRAYRAQVGKFMKKTKTMGYLPTFEWWGGGGEGWLEVTLTKLRTEARKS